MSRVFVALCVLVVVCTSADAAALDKLRKNRTAQCSAKGGSCLSQAACTAAKGTVLHNLCGAGALYCCVTKKAAPAVTPSKPSTPSAPAAPSAFANGVDVSLGQSLDTMKCFLDPTHPKHKVTSMAGSGAIGPALTTAQANMIHTSKFERFGIRTPLLNGQSPVPTIQNAIAAGFAPANIHVYFISFNAAEGAAKTLARMKVQAAALRKTQIGTLWLDVEDGPHYWTTNTATNCAYLTALVKDIQADKVNFPWALGIYSGISTWNSKVGVKCDMTTFRSLPFWYAAYTGKADFSYMTSHHMANGWSQANVCQWRGTTGFCGAQVDFNIFRL